MSKQHLYEANIKRSLGELYRRMESLIHDLPENYDDMTDEQLERIEYVEAIEQEWCLDPDMRKSISLIQWEDDE